MKKVVGNIPSYAKRGDDVIIFTQTLGSHTIPQKYWNNASNLKNSETI